MDYREELFKALTAGVDGVFRDKSIDTLVEVCKAARKEGYNAGLEDGKKQKEPPLKMGDRVRTLVEKDNMGMVRFPVGTIGEVTGFDGNAIEVSVDEKKWYYLKKDIELANDVILVGDEVYLLDANYHAVVTAVWEKSGAVKTETLTQSGKLSCTNAADLHRTGRHFPQIEEVLKQMQEGNE